MSRDFGTRTRIGGYLNTREPGFQIEIIRRVFNSEKKMGEKKEKKPSPTTLWRARPALGISDDQLFDFRIVSEPARQARDNRVRAARVQVSRTPVTLLVFKVQR